MASEEVKGIFCHYDFYTCPLAKGSSALEQELLFKHDPFQVRVWKPTLVPALAEGVKPDGTCAQTVAHQSA